MRAEGMKLVEIGQEYGLSEQALDYRLARIKRLLGEPTGRDERTRGARFG
jgi:hypothetical protein